MSPIDDAVHAIAWILAGIGALAGAAALVRWAKRGGRGAAVLGSTLVLLLGGGLAPDRSQQRIEEAREEKGRKTGESGDPPHRPVKRDGVGLFEGSARVPSAEPRERVVIPFRRPR